MEIPKIYAAITAIMADVGFIAKAEKNVQQGFMFRGIDTVMNELHAIFAKHKVFILPEVVGCEEQWRATAKGSSMKHTKLTIRFHFVADDGSEVTVTNVGEAMDTGDKSVNKAMSIALKYALMQMLLIPTKEDKDPDRVTPPETRSMTADEQAAMIDDSILREAFSRLDRCRTREEVSAVWNQYADLKKYPAFVEKVRAVGLKVQDDGAGKV